MSEPEKKDPVKQEDLERYGVWLDESDDDEVPTLHEVLENNPDTLSLEEELESMPDSDTLDDTAEFNFISSKNDITGLSADPLTKKLQEEITALRDELDTLKVTVATLATKQRSSESVAPEADQGGFFEYDVNDDTIALTDNELDNIFKTSNIVESERMASSAEEAAGLVNTNAVAAEQDLSPDDDAEDPIGFFEAQSESSESVVVDNLDSLISEDTKNEAVEAPSIQEQESLESIPVEESNAEPFIENDDFPITEDINIPDDTSMSEFTVASESEQSIDIDDNFSDLELLTDTDDEIAHEQSSAPEQLPSEETDTGVEGIPYPTFDGVDDADESFDSFDSFDNDEPDNNLFGSSSLDMHSDDSETIELDSLDIELADDTGPAPTQAIEDSLKKPLIDVLSLIKDLNKKNPDSFNDSMTAEKKESLEYLISLLKE